MNKSDEDTAVVDVANVEWGVYKMHHLITDLTTSQCEKKKDHPREEAFQLWSFQLFIQIVYSKNSTEKCAPNFRLHCPIRTLSHSFPPPTT